MLSDQDLKRLLAGCESKNFETRRDTAILRMFIDTGLRRSELAYLQIEDVDLDNNLARSSASSVGYAWCHLDAGPPRPSTVTSASVPSMRTLRAGRCGSVASARWPIPRST
jgi:integrase